VITTTETQRTQRLHRENLKRVINHRSEEEAERALLLRLFTGNRQLEITLLVLVDVHVFGVDDVVVTGAAT